MLKEKRILYIWMLFLIIIFVIVFIFALFFGRYRISFSVFFGILFSKEGYEIERSIIVNLRLPRTIIAALTGLALSVSGLLYQEVFQNKLVSPDLLGVSSGAGVGAAFAILINLPTFLISFCAFVSGITTVLITLFVAKIMKNKSITILTLSGIIVGGCMSSILAFIKYLADAETTLSSITFWLMGSFENSTISDVYILSLFVIICSIVALLISYRVSIISLGKEQAQTKGINYNFYRSLIIIISTLLTACSVAISGTISWIGLVVPHIVRLMAGRNVKKTLPLCMITGAIFMVIVDIISRSFTASEIPISAVTGLFGTIIFVVLLFARRNSIHEND